MYAAGVAAAVSTVLFLPLMRFRRAKEGVPG
jgi:hypothetical protein